MLSLRPFDVQQIGGTILHEGEIAEMRTGEGKTLVSVMPAYLNALSGKGARPAGAAATSAPMLGQAGAQMAPLQGCCAQKNRSHDANRAWPNIGAAHIRRTDMGIAPSISVAAGAARCRSSAEPTGGGPACAAALTCRVAGRRSSAWELLHRRRKRRCTGGPRSFVCGWTV